MYWHCTYILHAFTAANYSSPMSGIIINASTYTSHTLRIFVTYTRTHLERERTKIDRFHIRDAISLADLSSKIHSRWLLHWLSQTASRNRSNPIHSSKRNATRGSVAWYPSKISGEEVTPPCVHTLADNLDEIYCKREIRKSRNLSVFLDTRRSCREANSDWP